MKHIVILTGAGISAESGLKTFRDGDGLWMGYNVQDVATPGAFRKDPQLVLNFYNMRRRDVAAALPNVAHHLLAELEKEFKVTIITQNIDDLHERAGSSNILHLHGEIFKMHSVKNPKNKLEIRGDINLGDVCQLGGQYRPSIVWFEEPVPMIEVAMEYACVADVFVVIGTSLQVYPAASLINFVKLGTPIFIVDRSIPGVYGSKNITEIELPATEGVPKLIELLREIKI